MAGLQFTYIFPPNFSYRPEDLPLGSLLPIDRKTKLPDPSLPLVDPPELIRARAEDVRKEIESPTGKPWSYTGVSKTARSGGLTFELPFVSPVGVSGKMSRERGIDIHIECESVRTTSFRPSRQYIAKALNHITVKGYAEHYFRPSLFMVTGIKVAERVKLVVGRGIARSTNGKIGLDFSGLGISLDVGTHGSANSNVQDKIQTELHGPLVLAYQVKHIRIKSNDDFVVSDYTVNAVLFSDEHREGKEASAEDSLSAWDIEDLSAEGP